jgi:hypothetical protein
MPFEIVWLDYQVAGEWRSLHRLTASDCNLENDVDRWEMRLSTLEAGLSAILTFSYPSIFLSRHIIVAACLSAINPYHI